MTRAARKAKPGQTLDPVLPVQPVPGPNRIVVKQQHRGDIFATHAAVQKHKRIGTPRQPMLGQAIASQLNKIFPFRGAQKSRAYHGADKNPLLQISQALFRTLNESGYTSKISERSA